MGILDLNNPLHYLAITIVAGIVILIIRLLVIKITKGRGIIRCNLERIWVSPRKPDGAGGSKPCSYEEAAHVDYSVSLDFFSEKATPTVIRNPFVIFEKQNNEVAKKKTIPHFLEGVDLPLTPNNPIKYNIYGTLREDKLSDYWIIVGSTRVYFEGSFPNKKKIKILISKNPQDLIIQQKIS